MQQLMNLKMTRLEFLQFLGVAIVTLLGIGNLMSFMARLGRQDVATGLRMPSSGHGFGSRGFGE